jgi:hypothetical protein
MRLARFASHIFRSRIPPIFSLDVFRVALWQACVAAVHPVKNTGVGEAPAALSTTTRRCEEPFSLPFDWLTARK